MVDHSGRPVDFSKLANSLTWLQEEQQQSRSVAEHMQQRIERLEIQLDERVAQDKAVDEALALLRQQLARVPLIEEIVSQNRDNVGRVDGLVAEIEKFAAQMQRSVEADLQSLRASTAELQQHEMVIRSAVEAVESKVRALELGEPRRQDAIATLEQRYLDLAKLAEAADTRSRSVNEQIKRAHDQVEQISAHLTSLVTQDDLLSTRSQVIAEQLKSVDDKVDKLNLEMEQLRPLSDRLDVLRAEQQRMAHDLGGIIQGYSHLGEQVEQLSRLVRETNSRNRESFDKMMTLRQEVWEFSQQTQEFVAQLLRIEERQKRRQITEIEQQIKELRGHKGQLGEAPVQ